MCRQAVARGCVQAGRGSQCGFQLQAGGKAGGPGLGGGGSAMASSSGTDVIQVTNVSPSASSEQMRTLFGFLGKIEELRLFPPE
uniref:RRM domain-containing protein n=1 Tax=Gopherus agassizii TaxID=38772 RepID=A0A452ITI3_9SAUR